MPIRMKQPTVGAPYASVPALRLPSEAHVMQRREAFVNELSAWISLAGLTVLLMDKNAMVFEFITWQSFIPTARNPSTVGYMRDFRAELQESCDIPKLAIANFQVSIETNKVMSTYTAMPLAFEMTAFHPSFLLIWVHAWSAGFQSYRSSMLYKALDKPATGRQPGRFERLSLSVWLAVCAHVLLWWRILSLEALDVSNGVKIVFLAVTSVVAFWPLLSGARYKGDLPDIGRWLEYSLTLPLQIVIVACSVWIRDRASLYALFSAQVTLMMCGKTIEDNVQKIYRCNEKITRHELFIDRTDPNSDTTNWSDCEEDNNLKTMADHVTSKQRKRSQAVYVVLNVLVLAWSAFALIWYVIITQFQRQNKHAGACDACAAFTAAACPTSGSADICEITGGACQGRKDIPPAVKWIVTTQCLLFGLFGLIQSLQIYSLRNVTSRELATAAWHRVSYSYAILSVAAKSVLEIGFLVMLTQMPASVRRA